MTSVVRDGAPALSVHVDATWNAALLRADTIQRDTLTALARAWREKGGEDDISSALTVLSDVTAGNASPPEEDAAVEELEGAACLDYAQMRLNLHDALRLRDQLDDAIRQLARFNPAAAGGDSSQGDA